MTSCQVRVLNAFNGAHEMIYVIAILLVLIFLALVDEETAGAIFSLGFAVAVLGGGAYWLLS